MDCCPEDLRKCLPQTTFVSKCCGTANDAGDLRYEDPCEVPVYVEISDRISDNTESTERITRHMMIFVDEIKDHDRIWLPNEDPECCNHRMPSAVNVCFDFDRKEVSHWEVTV